MMLRTLTLRILSTALLINMIAVGARCGDRNSNPKVLPPDGKAYGLTYGEWGAVWWNWAFSSPIEVNPLTDTTGEFCDTNQTGNVWFLAGFLDLTGQGGPLERTCTIPAGKALFFPIINTVLIGEPGDTEEELRALANAETDAVSVLEAEIDGEPLSDLWRYRAESPAFPIVLPEGAILDQLAELNGVYEPSVADGYWLMLAPLSAGEHEIHFRGVKGDPANPDFEVEITYHLTVQPGT